VWRRRSFRIALRILTEIREQKTVNGMTQKRLADALDVSPQYINKVLRGQENLTLETISKIEQVLGITLIEIPQFSAVVSMESTKGSLTVCKNLSKPIGSKTASIEDEKWSDFEISYEPDGTYGY
jgi:transcriptional regulator with XRE-family HTH domain